MPRRSPTGKRPGAPIGTPGYPAPMACFSPLRACLGRPWAACLVALVLGGCGRDEGPSGAERRAATAAIQAIELVALAAEIAAPAVLGPASDTTLCPAVSRVGGFVTLDYGDGCLPDRGWVGGPVSGSTRLEVGTTAAVLALDGLSAGGGPLGGGVELVLGGAGGTVLVASLRPGLDDAPVQVETELFFAVDGADATFTGPLRVQDVDGADVTVDADGLVVAPLGSAPCFAPAAGTAAATYGINTSTLTFSDDGTVSLRGSRDERATEDEVCAFSPGIFRP